MLVHVVFAPRPVPYDNRPALPRVNFLALAPNPLQDTFRGPSATVQQGHELDAHHHLPPPASLLRCPLHAARHRHPYPFGINDLRLLPLPSAPQGTFSGQEDGGMLARVSGHLSSAGLSLSSNVRHSMDAGAAFVRRSTVLDEAELVEAAQDEVRAAGRQGKKGPHGNVVTWMTVRDPVLGYDVHGYHAWTPSCSCGKG